MIKGKLILEGKIELVSPAMIGCGRDENSDMDVIRDANGKPYIPATSFTGVLRHAIKLDNSYKKKLEEFWGTPKKDNTGHKDLKQSSIIVSDLMPEGNVEVVIRDGVKIDNKKGIAEKGAKFDYEVIEPGAKFKLNIEVNLNGNEDDFKKQMLATIINLLKSEKIRIGAKTNSGFGKIKLVEQSICEFDFSKKQDVFRWLKQDFSNPIDFNIEPLRLTQRTFSINADFVIKNSLIIRSYNIEPDMPDTEHIKSKGKPVLPGTSLKGAIRARAERIVNTLQKPETIIKDLFGDVEEEKKTAKKGRILIEETVLEGYPEEVQTRIKIDRFTGGTIESALLETKPLFRGKDEKIFNVRMTINDYKEHEAGLMLLVLKDLWTGDLPVGGEKAIGRGVLEGRKAIIKWDDREIVFEDPTRLNDSEKQQLQEFVKALVNNGGATC